MPDGARDPVQPTPPRGVGVLGGSFNPPHRTHVRLAREALRLLPIDELRVIPSGDHPHKRGRDMAPAAHRLAMCRLAFAGIDGVVVDDRELRRDGRSFTVDTLEELRRERPDARLFFLIGSDNLPLLPTWHAHHRLLELATVVTWPRRGHPVDERRLAALDLTEGERRALLANVLDVAADEVAATDVRDRVRAGDERPDELPELPEGVADYLAKHDVYR